MKKIILALLLFTTFSYSQSVKPYTILFEENARINNNQFDFLKKIKLLYEDIYIPDNVNNYRKNNKDKTLKETIFYSSDVKGYKLYNFTLDNKNLKFDYFFMFDSETPCIVQGSIYDTGDTIYRYEHNVCGKYNFVRFYRNSDLVYSTSIADDNVVK